MMHILPCKGTKTAIIVIIALLGFSGTVSAESCTSGTIHFPDGSKLHIVQSATKAMRSYITRINRFGKVVGRSCMREDMSLLQARRAYMIAKARFVKHKVPAKYRLCK